MEFKNQLILVVILFFISCKENNDVLNSTDEASLALSNFNNYNFRMMGVSEKKWGNFVVQNNFTVE